MKHLVAFAVGALVGAAGAVHAVINLDRAMAGFFASVDESLATLEDM